MEFASGWSPFRSPSWVQLRSWFNDDNNNNTMARTRTTIITTTTTKAIIKRSQCQSTEVFENGCSTDNPNSILVKSCNTWSCLALLPWVMQSGIETVSVCCLRPDTFCHWWSISSVSLFSFSSRRQSANITVTQRCKLMRILSTRVQSGSTSVEDVWLYISDAYKANLIVLQSTHCCSSICRDWYLIDSQVPIV